MSHVTTKPAFGVCDQLRHKPACSATDTGLGLEISAVASRSIHPIIFHLFLRFLPWFSAQLEII